MVVSAYVRDKGQETNVDQEQDERQYIKEVKVVVSEWVIEH